MWEEAKDGVPTQYPAILGNQQDIQEFNSIRLNSVTVYLETASEFPG